MDIWLDLDGTILDVQDRYYAAYVEYSLQNSLDVLDQNWFWILKRKKEIGLKLDLETWDNLLLDKVFFNPPRGVIITRRQNPKLCDLQLREFGITLPVIYTRDKKNFLQGKSGVMIGDSERDIEAANANGLVSVAVCSGLRCFELLDKAEPNFIFEDLREAYSSLDRIRAYWQETRRNLKTRHRMRYRSPGLQTGRKRRFQYAI